MPSGKRYSNATFTKRVDHDGGVHRPPRAPSEPRVCSQCGAAYLRRRWVPASDPRAVALHYLGGATATVCRGCKEVAARVPSGYLTIAGRFFTLHRFEIEQLLEHEVRHASEENPLARVIQWNRSDPAKLELTTTTEHLAGRLGHALHNAYRGMVHYDYSHENKVVRVTWHRD